MIGRANGRLLAGSLLSVWALTGCSGVQAGDDPEGSACEDAQAFVAIKGDTDTLDRRMINLRPTAVTLDSVKALAPRYREASDEYDELLGRAREEFHRARAEGSDFLPVWQLTTESLTIRRDGFVFIAKTFANPESLRDPAVLEQVRSWERKILDVNARVEERSNRWLRGHGFEETDDGNFIIDC
jgi:hypothetical protein